MKLITKLFVITTSWKNSSAIREVEMAQKQNPTDAELDLLKVLWEHGPCTVNEVHAHLKDNPPRGYTTVLKLLQIMAEKGLVKRDENHRAHVYRAITSDKQVHRNLVRRLLVRAFDNSTSKLIAQALDARPISPDELAEIRAMLDKMEKGVK
ncbi:MAG: BlaI/MecI/CopY family transcriptional regulator [Candidatus Zixiibacteriota bacterium]